MFFFFTYFLNWDQVRTFESTYNERKEKIWIQKQGMRVCMKFTHKKPVYNGNCSIISDVCLTEETVLHHNTYKSIYGSKYYFFVYMISSLVFVFYQTFIVNQTTLSIIISKFLMMAYLNRNFTALILFHNKFIMLDYFVFQFFSKSFYIKNMILTFKNNYHIIFHIFFWNNKDHIFLYKSRICWFYLRYFWRH